MAPLDKPDKKARETFASLGKLSAGSKVLTIRIKGDLWRRLQGQARSQGRTASELARQFIAEGLERER